MSPPPDESVPEAIPERPAEATGEISMLPPEEAQKVAAEIRAVAESRGEDSEVVELVELPARRVAAGPAPQHLPPMPTTSGAGGRRRTEDELSSTSCATRGRCSISTSAATACACCRARTPRTSSSRCRRADQAALLLHFRPGQRRQWMRLLEPDDVADVIQDAAEEQRADAARAARRADPQGSASRCSRTPRTRPAA